MPHDQCARGPHAHRLARPSRARLAGHRGVPRRSCALLLHRAAPTSTGPFGVVPSGCVADAHSDLYRPGCRRALMFSTSPSPDLGGRPPRHREPLEDWCQALAPHPPRGPVNRARVGSMSAPPGGSVLAQSWPALRGARGAPRDTPRADPAAGPPIWGASHMVQSRVPQRARCCWPRCAPPRGAGRGCARGPTGTGPGGPGWDRSVRWSRTCPSGRALWSPRWTRCRHRRCARSGSAATTHCATPPRRGHPRRGHPRRGGRAARALSGRA